MPCTLDAKLYGGLNKRLILLILVIACQCNAGNCHEIPRSRLSISQIGASCFAVARLAQAAKPEGDGESGSSRGRGVSSSSACCGFPLRERANE